MGEKLTTVTAVTNEIKLHSAASAAAAAAATT